MVITTKFDILQRMFIVAISSPARVLQIKHDGTMVAYHLEYWCNGEIKSVWLYEDELSEEKAKH